MPNVIRDTVLLLVLVIGAAAALGMYGATFAPGSSSHPNQSQESGPTLQSGAATEVPRAHPNSTLTANEAESVERWIVAYTNAMRVNYNHTPLVWNPDLADVARAHSYDMAKRDFYNHTNPDGKEPWDRAESAGFSCATYAENIAAVPYPHALGPYNEERVTYNSPKGYARDIVAGFLASGGHRWSMLTPKYDVVGVGVYASNEDGWKGRDDETKSLKVTMMFCERPGWPDHVPGGMTAPVVKRALEYNRSYWEPYPSGFDAPWDNNTYTGPPDE